MAAPEPQNNLFVALLLSIIVMGGWYYFYEMPRAKQAQEQQVLLQQQKEGTAPIKGMSPVIAAEKFLPRNEALEAAPRIPIKTARVSGSIALRGARFDDLTLTQYKETSEKDSANVMLLSPKESQMLYFGSFGWVSSDTSVTLPDENTLWQTSGNELGAGKPLTLWWENAEAVRFEITLTVDDEYLFHITQKIVNNSANAIQVANFGLLNRSYKMPENTQLILHEGAIGVFGDKLQENSYENLVEEKEASYEFQTGWTGISDKYWLTAIIPPKGTTHRAHFQHYTHENQDRFQVDVLGPMQTIASGAEASTDSRFFAGAKEVSLLDKYSEEYGIPLFDRAVDFGSLYFLTKPLFHLLHFFHGLVGNFGVAIILLTLCIRIALFPLANKSYKSMAQMKNLMPKMTELKERYSDDKLKMNQEIMQLYKREKVNPASGCLPMLVQLPIFFALYKVLFVTLEMRHAPFFGWIHDLSEKDPTNVFTLFGLVNWDPPSMLHIGAWPLIMTATTIIQMRLSPKPTDPAQAMMMQWMPVVFLVLFANFPAGLVVYWTFNNFFSILQQWFITKKLDRSGKTRKKNVDAAVA